MATEDESLAVKPWTSYDWTHNKRVISPCIIRFKHITLLHAVLRVDDTDDHKEIAWLLESAAHAGHVVLVKAIFELGFKIRSMVSDIISERTSTYRFGILKVEFSRKGLRWSLGPV